MNRERETEEIIKGIRKPKDSNAFKIGKKDAKRTSGGPNIDTSQEGDNIIYGRWGVL
jgi:hypothetical protein